MERSTRRKTDRRAYLLGGALVLAAASLMLPSGVSQEAPKPKPNQYIGASKCKSCHSAADAGDQHGKWLASAHAKAFERLASPEAKAAGKERGIEDPQKAESCLKCHTTAFGLPAEEIKRGFDQKLGVQCEACHGPGDNHVKARMTAASKNETGPIPAGEVILTPVEATCRACHNQESPTFQRFCYYEFVEKVRHHNPKLRSAEELAKELVCGCTDCACKHDCAEGCAVPRGERK